MTADPFGTAALRRAVVDAWRASPTRLREDANLEDDHARGYYRDRVVVELAQNAADAAARDGVPGRVRFRLDTTAHPATLEVSNVGAPLDAAGVASLASLRASAKGEGVGAVGRFGVGFAAVRAVSDDITISSATGGVRFASALARDDLAGADQPSATRVRVDQAAGDHGGGPTPEPHREVPGWRRGVAQIAVLRLPHPAPAAEGGETVVRLVLRDQDAVAAVRAQLDAVDDALLLALPALKRVEIEVDDEGPRVLDGLHDRWTVRRAEGHLTSDDVAELPAEQRRTAWSLVWALPRDPGHVGAGVSRVLHAPTPTDVPLTFPAVLVATFPVDPGRRRVLPGAATDRLAVEAGRAYAALLGDVAAERGPDVLDLVPADLPAGELDAAVREAALAALASTPLLDAPARVSRQVRAQGSFDADDVAARDDLSWPHDLPRRPSVSDSELSPRVAPRDAVLLAGPVGEDEDVAAVVGTVPLAVRHHATARRLGACIAPLADALDELASLPPARWRAVYAALAPHLSDPSVREAVAGAPVPLADGRLAHGARGLTLPDTAVSPAVRRLSVPSGARIDDELPDSLQQADGARDWVLLGLRVVHPAAAHPVLARVGAMEFEPRALLADPGVRAAGLGAAARLLDGGGGSDGDGKGDGGKGDGGSERCGNGGERGGGGSDDGERGNGGEHGDGWSDDRAVVDAVLRLVAQAVEAAPAEALPFWLGELPVDADGGTLTPARETALPGTWAAEHLDALAVVDDDAVDRAGADVLLAMGAHAALDVYRVDEAVTGEPDEDDDDEGAAAWLADWSAYLAHLGDRWGPDVLVDEVEAIADLDAVAEDSWPHALALIAARPDLRRALLTPVRPGLGARPGAALAPSYASWWLRRHLGAPFALHDAVPLLPPAPPETRGLDDLMLRALGGVGALGEQRPEDWPTVLASLGAVGAPMPVRDALALWSGLAAAAVAASPEDRATLLDPLPDRLPALRGDQVVVSDADAVVVATGRRWAQLGPVLPASAGAAEALADLLDLPLAAERHPADEGEECPLDPRVVGLDPRLPAVWRRHGTLRVDGRPVRYWVHGGEAHATDDDALADALADLLNAPHLAAALREALAAPDRAAALWAATAWQP